MKGVIMLENNRRLNLSKYALEMIYDGKRLDTTNEKKQIVDTILAEGLPVYKKVVEFQELYGGLCYKIGEQYYEGFSLNLVWFNDSKNRYELRYTMKKDDIYFFECMDYHYAGDVGPCIDMNGKIYDFGMGRVFIRANSIEEFLEDEAIKFYFVKKQNKWLNRGALCDEFQVFKQNVDLIRVENSMFSRKYFDWWKDQSESIFIRTDLTGHSTYAQVYCKDKDSLVKLYNEDKPVSIYPSK